MGSKQAVWEVKDPLLPVSPRSRSTISTHFARPDPNSQWKTTSRVSTAEQAALSFLAEEGTQCTRPRLNICSNTEHTDLDPETMATAVDFTSVHDDSHNDLMHETILNRNVDPHKVPQARYRTVVL